MEMRDGKRFVWEKPETIINHLESVQRLVFPAAAEDLRIKDDGRQLYLEIMGPGYSIHPMRKSFLIKLFTLFRFPLPKPFGTSLSTETIVSIGNDLLLRIEPELVYITLEDNDAFTLDLQEPDTHPALRLIRSIQSSTIGAITYNDIFQRIRLRSTYRSEIFFEHEFAFSAEIISSNSGIVPIRFYPCIKHVRGEQFALMKQESTLTAYPAAKETFERSINDRILLTENRFPEIERLILASSFEYIRSPESPPYPMIKKTLLKTIKSRADAIESRVKAAKGPRLRSNAMPIIGLSFPMSFFDLFLTLSAAAKFELPFSQLRTERSAGTVIEYVALCGAHR